ncbi:MAG: response regulator [Rhodoferax sp.]|nr:response regulator [Rhodoferax sp.]
MFSNFLTSRQAARMLGVSVPSVQEWVERGKLEGWKTAGGHRRITHASVLRVMQERQEASALAARPQAMSILIVEDDENLIRLYKVHIAQWPMLVSVFTAGNGYEALVMVGEIKPQLLICDLRLPGVNGFGVIRGLCHIERYRDMGIVVISGMPVPEIDAHGGLPARVQVLGKPIDFARLKEIAQHHWQLATVQATPAPE